MELRRFARLARQHILLVTVTVIVGAAIGYVATPRTALYSSSATIYVGPRQLADFHQSADAAVSFDEILATLANMLPSSVVATAAIQSTHADRSPGQATAETTASVVPGTHLISVTVTDTEPAVAAVLANGMADAFVAGSRNSSPSAAVQPGALPSEPAYVFQPASPSSTPQPSGKARHVLLGALLGLVVAILAILLLDYLDFTVRDPADLERRLELPVFGVIPRRRDLATGGGLGPTLGRPREGDEGE